MQQWIKHPSPRAVTSALPPHSFSLYRRLFHLLLFFFFRKRKEAAPDPVWLRDAGAPEPTRAFGRPQSFPFSEDFFFCFFSFSSEKEKKKQKSRKDKGERKRPRAKAKQGRKPLQESFQIELWRDVQRIRRVAAVLLSLAHALGEQIFDLPVDGAEIILSPGGDGLIELWRQTQRNLLFLQIVHAAHGAPQ